MGGLSGGGFEGAYSSRPPWEIGRPQAALAELAESGAWRGSLLDAGCGTGEHALLAAGLGLAATGVDGAPTAIAMARAKARDRGLEVRFLVGDVLDLHSLEEQFETVVDSGVFHVFDDRDRRRYVENLKAVLGPGGRCFVLCFSDTQPGQIGPRRVSEAEILDSFSEGWSVDAVEPATFELTVDPRGARAWRVSLTRT